MTNLTIKDLTESATLDQHTLSSVRGGLNAVLNNSQQANQNVAGSFGPIMAINSPVSAPSTVLTESNPVTIVDLTSISLISSHQNAIFSV
ncbi:hypothetical protein [Thiothrix nivea]|uniref:Uncharacterized protein n=1 Tax=Thiothrix nivea (strain ATCC 35100 / DSM 5205 / JP2) TaxID=870187 RepID=A0A656HNV9_THINJ|nr:hypothetical protein [Thiothrix nivea]EIJ37049.1 hypothetical protein Thini_0036 [Thiothrix nivea DSM 5205]